MGVVPYSALRDAMRQCGLATRRYRKLPLELMAYYVICMTLYSKVSLQEVLLCILEWSKWLKINLPCQPVEGRGGISRARKRLGSEVMRVLFETVCVSIGTRKTKGAFYKKMATGGNRRQYA